MRVIIGASTFVFILVSCNAANILTVFPHIGKSHFFMFEPYVRKLSDLGHDVTVVSHFEPSVTHQKLKHVSLAGSTPSILYNSIRLDEIPYVPPPGRVFGSLYFLNQYGIESCQGAFKHQPFLNYLQTTKKIDLVVIEFFNSDCFASLAWYFNAPLIGIFSSANMPWHTDRFGLPDNPAYISNHFLGNYQKMSYTERLINTVATYSMKIFYPLINDRQAYKITSEYFGQQLPPLKSIVANSSLFLLNSHFSLFQPRPLVPGIIELGGFHVQPAKKLPQDFLELVEGSKNGIVLFSFGSTLLGSTMPNKTRQAIVSALGRINLDVLMKWEAEEFPDKPKNVMFRKWLPQNDLLGHPKVKAFVTHAGLMGVEEAVYHGVPMVLVPVVGDQPMNAAACAEKGVGEVVDYFSLTETNFYEALNKVITDEKYTQNAKKLAQIFKDRPMTTLDTATYWTEYVLRYNGAPQLRSAAVDLPWYQEMLLDVLAVILFVIFLFLYLIFAMYKKFICFLFFRNKNEISTNKKKN